MINAEISPTGTKNTDGLVTGAGRRTIGSTIQDRRRLVPDQNQPLPLVGGNKDVL